MSRTAPSHAGETTAIARIVRVGGRSSACPQTWHSIIGPALSSEPGFATVAQSMLWSTRCRQAQGRVPARRSLSVDSVPRIRRPLPYSPLLAQRHLGGCQRVRPIVPVTQSTANLLAVDQAGSSSDDMLGAGHLITPCLTGLSAGNGPLTTTIRLTGREKMAGYLGFASRARSSFSIRCCSASSTGTHCMCGVPRHDRRHRYPSDRERHLCNPSCDGR